jgi:hypothetical protein
MSRRVQMQRRSAQLTCSAQQRALNFFACKDDVSQPLELSNKRSPFLKAYCLPDIYLSHRDDRA